MVNVTEQLQVLMKQEEEHGECVDCPSLVGGPAAASRWHESGCRLSASVGGTQVQGGPWPQAAASCITLLVWKHLPQSPLTDSGGKTPGSGLVMLITLTWTSRSVANISTS